jgi:hypothetical protein
MGVSTYGLVGTQILYKYMDICGYVGNYAAQPDAKHRFAAAWRGRVCHMLRAAWCALHAPCRTLAVILPCSMLHRCVACGTVARCTSYCTQSPGPSPWRAPRWLGQAASLRKSCIAASVVNMFGAPSVRVAVSASCAEQHSGISHRAACAAGCEGGTANRNKGA